MHYAIGIDIGATKIKGVIAANNGKIILRRKIETGVGRRRSEILRDIGKLIKYLKKEAKIKHLKLQGIGVGVPGVVENGKIIFGGGTMKQFIGFDLKKEIGRISHLKTNVKNDSECFSLAESLFGAGKNYGCAAGITWGTGIGGGFVNKKVKPMIVRSFEIGHIVVEPDMKSEPKDACGQQGCVENLASGKNIIRRYHAKGGRIKNLGIKEIFRSKEKAAKAVLADAYKYMSLAITALIDILNPEIIIIGGGAGIKLLEAGRKRLEKNIRQYGLKVLTKDLKIAKSKIGEYAGALGAATLIFDEK